MAFAGRLADNNTRYGVSPNDAATDEIEFSLFCSQTYTRQPSQKMPMDYNGTPTGLTLTPQLQQTQVRSARC